MNDFEISMKKTGKAGPRCRPQCRPHSGRRRCDGPGRVMVKAERIGSQIESPVSRPRSEAPNPVLVPRVWRYMRGLGGLGVSGDQLHRYRRRRVVYIRMQCVDRSNAANLKRVQE